MPLSESFYALLLTTSSGVLLALCSYALKSKCSNLRCCGMEIQRDVALEERYEERVLDQQRDRESPRELNRLTAI
jgi:hypothetical protein